MGEKEIQVEIARRFLVDCWQSFSGESGCGWGISRNAFNVRDGHKIEYQKKREVEVWQSLPQRILEASPHLQGYDAADLPWDEIERLKRERGWNVIEALDYLGL